MIQQSEPGAITRWLGAALSAVLLSLSAPTSATPVTAASAPGAVFRTPLRDLPASLARLLQTAQQLRAVQTGPEHGPEITVFFDPNCPACAHLWPRVAPQAPRVRIRWIPVAWARPESLGVAAAILDAPDPARSLAHNEAGFDWAQGHGAHMPAFHIAAATRDDVLHNTTVWHDQIGMLPALLYRDTTGVHLFIGTPSAPQWQAILRRIGPLGQGSAPAAP
ncbi:MAG: hypothetical protein J0I24_00120 [Thiomonas arsenitoxydans]|uniref:Thioredoxin-like fold domain-containing protein n=1 Tax=Thiomonas arsenitoxydans (strain DSM 22701 / CIP 110005 / 3As) TaxID=426114 RepID=A0A8I1MRT5_THIA3|nr:hypothetical protein [Thiomonas arsenitoxydans]MBN8742691.1 hypothetical protein [Thiomonas arsenitoxydans]